MVHGFPYRLTVEPLSDANRNCRRQEEVQWRNTPWRSFRRAERGVAPASPRLESVVGSTGTGTWRFLRPHQDGALARLNGFVNATDVHEYAGRSAEGQSALTALGLTTVQAQAASPIASRPRPSAAPATSSDQQSSRKRSADGRKSSRESPEKKRRTDEQGTSAESNGRSSPPRVSISSYAPINPAGLPQGGYWTWEPDLPPAEMNRRNNAYLAMLNRDHRSKYTRQFSDSSHIPY